MPDIYGYSDYRKYLLDFYNERRAVDNKFSHRFFAQRAGIHSSGFLSSVLQGDRNLTDPLMLQFAKVLGLKGDELEYFIAMVQFNQSKTTEQRVRHYEQMLRLKKVDITVLDGDQYDFYAVWYYSVIRELLHIYRFKDDYKELASRVSPSIRVPEARKAIRTLERLKLVARDKQGYLRPVESLVSTGSAFTSLAVANFQMAMSDLAKASIDRYKREERDLSTVTLTLSDQTFKYVRDEIGIFRKRLLALAKEDEKATRVYHLNLQMFPVTDRV